MGCYLSTLSESSDQSGEHNFTNVNNEEQITESKTTNASNVNEKAKLLFESLYTSIHKWNSDDYKHTLIEQYKEKIIGIFVYHLNKNNYLLKSSRSDIYYGNTKTDLCKILIELDNYGICICVVSDDTTSVLNAICSLIKINFALHIDSSRSSYSDNKVIVNLIDNK